MDTHVNVYNKFFLSDFMVLIRYYYLLFFFWSCNKWLSFVVLRTISIIITRTMPAHDVRTTLYGRCCDIKTLKRCRYNVVLTLCVGWEVGSCSLYADCLFFSALCRYSNKQGILLLILLHNLITPHLACLLCLFFLCERWKVDSARAYPTHINHVMCVSVLRRKSKYLPLVAASWQEHFFF